jgi:CheY-like chemotaxis protein
LGLATVFSIADQHQGWVEVSSQVGAGTTFRLYLPIAIEHIPVSTSTATEAPRGGVEKILLIEDDKSLRGAVHQALQNYGYTVIAADSGDAAQAVWAEHEEQFDLLLTDMVMPGGMTGVELAELLRGKKPSLRVILTSGYSRELSGSGAAKEKGLTFMHKPFSLRVLAETVRKCLDNS